MSGRFWKLLLSAHWLGEPQVAPYFLTPRAAILRKALALLGFNRPHGRRTPHFCGFGLALPFREAADGEQISGKFTGIAQLSSGKFAVVEKSHEFTLVPWRLVIERQLGREVMGVMQGGSVSWQFGRQKGLAL